MKHFPHNHRFFIQRLSEKWEGEAPAEPRTAKKRGSAGASPSPYPAFRTASQIVRGHCVGQFQVILTFLVAVLGMSGILCGQQPAAKTEAKTETKTAAPQPAAGQPATAPKTEKTEPAQPASLLPKLSEMQLPTATELLQEAPRDWIVLKTDEVLVVKPVKPRPDTLAQLLKTLEESKTWVAERVTKNAGESESDYRERVKKNLEDFELKKKRARYLDIQMPETVVAADAETYQIDIVKHIKEIVNHEVMMLRRIDLLLNEGKSREAYEMLLVLDQIHPDWPGADLRRQRLVFEEAKLQLDKGRVEPALAFYEQLHALNPRYTGLQEALGSVVYRLITSAVDADGEKDFRRARFFLKRLQRLEPQHKVVQSFLQYFPGVAGSLVQRSLQATQAGRHDEAVALAEQAVEVWPDLPNLRTVQRNAANRFQRLRVGVLRSAGDPPTAYPVPTDADERHRQLTETPLFEVDRADVGAHYLSRFFEEWEPTDLGRQLVFHLRQDRAAWESLDVLTAASIVSTLAERIRPGSSAYDERFAGYVDSLTVRSPFEFSVKLARIPVRTEPLFHFPVVAPSAHQATAGAGTPPALLSRRFQLHSRQNDGPVYRRSVAEPDNSAERHVAEVTEIKYSSYENAIQGLLRGEVSMLPRVPSWVYDDFVNDTGFFTIPYAVPTTHAVQFHSDSVPLRNPQLRSALAYAIDRQRVLRETVLRDPAAKRGRLVSAPYPSTSYAYAKASMVQLRPYDGTLSMALALIAKKQLGGAIPELKMACVPEPVAEQAAQALIAAWKRIGVQVTLVTGPPATDAAPPAAAAPAEAAPADASPPWDILYRTVRMDEPITQLWPFLTLQTQARVNDLSHMPDWLRQELIELEHAGHFNTAVRVLHRLHLDLQGQVVLIPLWEVDEFMVLRKNIQGLSSHQVADSRLMHPYHNIERWIVGPWYETSTGIALTNP